MRGKSWPIAALTAAVALGAAAAFLWRWQQPLALAAGTALPEPREIADFTLVDAEGKPFDRARLRGHWTVLFTGFTHCPDVCPTTLALFASLRKRVPDERIQFLFLSVDPERDTPEVVARYIAHFGTGLVGATGEREEIDRLTRELGLAQVRNPGPGEEYTVDHSTALVLFDPEARVAGYFTPPHDEQALAADLAALSSS
jgi:protein SCO1/2